MICARLSRWIFRRSSRNQIRSPLPVPSSCDSQADSSTPETEGSQNLQESQEAIQTVVPGELRKPQPPSFGLLPVELILMVFELLPAPDAICLALVCRGMFNISNVRYLARHLGERDKENLLCRLEKDITGVIYCFTEQKLVNFRVHGSSEGCIHRHGFSMRGSMSPAIFGGVIRIPYCHARLATNHQILGPQHGIPTSYLEETWDHIRRDHGVCWKEELAAKVINGELFIFFRHTFCHERADAAALQTFFSKRSIEICSHISLGAPAHFRVHVGLPINVTGNNEHYDKGWCGKCETDWEISIQWTGPERGWTVTARIYRGLGACRSPNDRKWKSRICSATYRETPRYALKDLWRT